MEKVSEAAKETSRSAMKTASVAGEGVRATAQMAMDNATKATVSANNKVQGKEPAEGTFESMKNTTYKASQTAMDTIGQATQQTGTILQQTGETVMGAMQTAAETVKKPFVGDKKG